MTRHFLIVGAGFSGAVCARELAGAGHQCTVIDSRPHVAGNCHTEREEDTNVMVHKYGPHIFHTSNEAVWNYVNQFGKWIPFINRVKAAAKGTIFPLPINLHTINQFFDKALSPEEAKAFFNEIGDRSIEEPANFEEQALKFIGKDLYETFFRGYTIKQWGCDPTELPASILKRLPVRFNYDDSYYNSRWQAMPQDGYSEIIQNILDHPHIDLRLSTAYDHSMREQYDRIIFTGPIDSFYDFCFGKLSYRTVFWERSVHEGDHQGNAVINYPDPGIPYTRIHEHKHFAPWETHEKTSVFTEFSKETESGDIPYYPKRLPQDMTVLQKYLEKAESDEGISFLGRLATYRYLDMHQVIAEALDFSRELIKAEESAALPPTFPSY